MMQRGSGAIATITFATVLSLAGVARAADGKALWDKHCGSCHGADGKGDTKAGKLTKVRDLNDPEVKAELTHDKVHAVISDGIVDKDSGKTRMKGFKDKLSAEEIDALTKHVLGLVGVQ